MTAAVAFDRSLEQRLCALELANEIRSLRAGLKREVRAGRLVVPVLVDPPWFAVGMRVGELLLAVRGVGRVKVNRWLKEFGFSQWRTVGSLSDRQRLLVAGRVADVTRGATG